jgi:hypothetical protein
MDHVTVSDKLCMQNIFVYGHEAFTLPDIQYGHSDEMCVPFLII